MDDHTFCRLLLKATRADLTPDQRRQLKGAWSYRYDWGDNVEFHVPNADGGEFYWNGRGCCAYSARIDGINAWIESTTNSEAAV